MSKEEARAAARSPRSLSGLLPFLKPYRGRIALALLFLVLAAMSTLAFPLALKSLIDQGLVSSDPGQRVMALRPYFLALFGVGAALGVFSAARFYMVSWLGERITADLRSAVYAHVVEQSPEFFESTQTGEVLSRLTTDTTLVQTVVGSSLSMGLRNTVMGLGALIMLVVTNPLVMTQVLGILVLVVLPSLYFGRRVRRLSRASQDRVADSSAIAAEVLNAIPIVQSYTQERRESTRFAESTEHAFEVARKRTRVRSLLVAFIITATFGALLWGLYQGTQAVMNGDITRRPPGADGGLRDHPGGQRGRAVRGVRRPAARRRRHRAADGAAGRALDGGRAGLAPAAAAGTRRLGLPAGERALPLPLAPAARHAARLQPGRGRRRDGGAGRAQRRRQEHGAAAAAALLRRAGRAGGGGRRAGAAAPRWPSCASASASCRRTA